MERCGGDWRKHSGPVSPIWAALFSLEHSKKKSRKRETRATPRMACKTNGSDFRAAFFVAPSNNRRHLSSLWRSATLCSINDGKGKQQPAHCHIFEDAVWSSRSLFIWNTWIIKHYNVQQMFLRFVFLRRKKGERRRGPGCSSNCAMKLKPRGRERGIRKKGKLLFVIGYMISTLRRQWHSIPPSFLPVTTSADRKRDPWPIFSFNADAIELHYEQL